MEKLKLLLLEILPSFDSEDITSLVAFVNSFYVIRRISESLQIYLFVLKSYRTVNIRKKVCNLLAALSSLRLCFYVSLV